MEEKFKGSVAKAGEGVFSAEKSRQENRDPSRANEFLNGFRDATDALACAKEQLRVVQTTKEDLQKERDSAITAWNRQEKGRVLIALAQSICREIPCIIIIRSWTGPPNCCKFAWTAASRRNQIHFSPVGTCNIASPVVFEDTATLGLEPFWLAL